MFYCATNAYVDPKTTLLYDAAAGSFASSEWIYGGKRASDGQSWWQVNGTPAYLWRPLTVSRLDTYTALTNGAGLSGPPDWSWTNNAQSVSVSSLGYVTNTVVFNTWQTLFLKSQWGAGDLPIVFDNVSFAPWLGVTRGQPFSWENPSSDNNIPYWNWPASSFTTGGNQYDWSRASAGLGWAIFQGFVTGTVGSTNVVFDATRANPGNLQGILTPDLSNGVGSVQFQASVSSGTSVYEVDCTSPNNNLLWNTIQVFTNVAGDTTNHFLNISQLGWGRIRIIQAPGVYNASNVLVSGSTSNAVLTIGNLTALGYPPQNLSSWVAYNALIASPDGINNTGSRHTRRATSTTA